MILVEAQTEKKVSTLYLKEGMYVSSLDRPWLDTPFLMQGFIIKDPDEILLLKKYCEHVFIDTDKGVDTEQYIHDAQNLKTNKRLLGAFPKICTDKATSPIRTVTAALNMETHMERLSFM